MELFVVKVPPELAPEVWSPAPDRELFVVHYPERPPCKRGDTVALEIDGRIVGQATVAYLVEPVHLYETWRVFWKPETFTPLS